MRRLTPLEREEMLARHNAALGAVQAGELNGYEALRFVVCPTAEELELQRSRGFKRQRGRRPRARVPSEV